MNEDNKPELRFYTLESAPQVVVDQWVITVPPPNPNDPPFPNPNHNPCCDDYEMRLAWTYVDEVIAQLKGMTPVHEDIIDKLEDASGYMARVLRNREL